MAERKVYFGPINNSHKDIFINKSKEYLSKNKGDRFYYILPTGNLLTKYREMLLEDLRGVFDINVITFDDIVTRALSKELYITIDDGTKETIIAKIVKDLYRKGKIIYYKDMIEMEGFITSLSYIIGEIKRSLVLPEVFDLKIPKEPRYKEISLIYEEYQRFINEKMLLDREESFIKAFEKLEGKEDFLNNLDFIIIDEFFDFRPQELKVLRAMCEKEIDIFINIPYKTKQNWETVNKTLDILKDMGFELIDIEDKEDKNYFERLSDDIFVKKEPYYEKSNKIALIKAPNKYIEVKKVCEEIKKLFKNGTDLNEIGVVVGNVERYKDVLLKVFKEENIPSTLTEELKLIDVPLIKEVLNLIEIRLNNFDKRLLIKGIKSGYLNVCDSIDKDRVEYILHSLKIIDMDRDFNEIIDREKRRLRFLIRNSEEKREIYEERLEDIVNLQFVIDTIKDNISKIPLKGTADLISQTLLNIIKDYELEKGIKDVYNYTKNYSLFQRDITAFAKLRRIIERVGTISKVIFADGEISLRAYYDTIVRLLKDEGLIVTSGSRKGVSVLTPSTSRGLKFSSLFVMGLTQGEYPEVDRNNWFFRDEDNELFKNVGIDIKNYKEKVDKECLLFNIVLTRAKDTINLSYTESGEGEEILIPSMFLDDFLGLFKGESISDKVNYTPLTIDYLVKEKIEDVTCDRELSRHLLYNHYNGKDVKEYLKYVDDIDEIYHRIEGEIKRYDSSFNEYDGLIKDKHISDDILGLYKDSKFSITQLDTYGRCPFRFLFEYVLKVETIEKEIEEFSSMDKGTLLHEVLAIYYKNHREDFEGYLIHDNAFDVENTRDEIKNIVLKSLENLGVTELTRLWEIRVEYIVNLVLSLVKSDLERLKAYGSKLIPWEFEIKFGYDRDFVITIGDMDIKLLGKIDRIDNLKDSNKFIVYDYKNSSYGIRSIKDIKEGVSFQLPVYIMSQIDLDREVIGGGYIVIKDGETRIEIIKDDSKTLVNKKSGNGILSAEEWDNLIKEVRAKIGDYINRIYRGDFRLKPLECDTYCPLAGMCRYDAERIARKDEWHETH